MLDIHSHILPGVDDGAADLAQSVEMLCAARAAGVTSIIATPHCRDRRVDLAHMQEAYNALLPEAEKLGISLYPGYEYHYRLFLDGGAEDARAFCLAGSNTLLLEFSSGPLPLQWENTVYSIQQEGMEVIIAHPERYASVQADLSVATRMREIGCELQVDVESLDVGAKAAERRCARELLANGLVSWLASDAHSRDAYDSLSAIREKYADKLRPPLLLEDIYRRHTAPPARKSAHRDRKRMFAWILTGIAALGVIAGAIGLGSYFYNQAKDRAAYESVRQLALAQTTPPIHTPVASPAATPEKTPDATSEPTPEPTPRFNGWYADFAAEADRDIDFESLQAVNPDIYAWISVEGTDIDYPIVHMETPGDPRYLDYDIYGNKNAAGAIYTDGFNHIDFADPNTLVYGHNMKDETMFTKLKNFEDARFFEENRTITLYLPGGAMLTYEIFAAYRTGHNHILAENNFYDPEVYKAYLDSILNTRSLSANIRKTELSIEDKIVTLVTCVGIDDRRLFVQGVLRDAR